MGINADSGVALLPDEKTGQILICCLDCRVPLQMAEHRTVFCPKCKKSDRGMVPTMILTCAECDTPLKVVEKQGSYCTNCNFPPSMQDTYFQKIKDS